LIVRTHVDLCSGIGGFALGFIASGLSEPVLFCDFDEKVRRLLRVRFPGIPIANDVKEIASDPTRFIQKRPFILSSGYPCQPFSTSGQRKGEEDPRHIFPYIAEVVAQTRPTYCVFENVYGHISLGLDKVLNQMGSLDYSTATFIVPATSFRPHKRDRLWIICKNMANTKGEGLQGWKFSTTIKSEEPRVSDTRTESSNGKTENVANTKSINRDEHEFVRENGNLKTQKVFRDRDGLSHTEGQSTQDHSQTFASFRRIFDGISGWLDEPRHLERTTHKNEYRADRLKQLGNALLPQITYRIGLAIKEIEENK